MAHQSGEPAAGHHGVVVEQHQEAAAGLPQGAVVGGGEAQVAAVGQEAQARPARRLLGQVLAGAVVGAVVDHQQLVVGPLGALAHALQAEPVELQVAEGDDRDRDRREGLLEARQQGAIALLPGVGAGEGAPGLDGLRRLLGEGGGDLPFELLRRLGQPHQRRERRHLGQRHRDQRLAGGQDLVDLDRVGGLGERGAQEGQEQDVEARQPARQLGVGLLAGEGDVRQRRQAGEVGAPGRAHQHEVPVRPAAGELLDQLGVEPVGDRPVVAHRHPPLLRDRSIGPRRDRGRPRRDLDEVLEVAGVAQQQDVVVLALAGAHQEVRGGEHQPGALQQVGLARHHLRPVAGEPGVVVHAVVDQRPGQLARGAPGEPAPERQLHQGDRRPQAGVAAQDVEAGEQLGLAGGVERVGVDVQPRPA